MLYLIRQCFKPLLPVSPRYINYDTIPPHNELKKIDLLRLQNFFKNSNKLFVLTGAGISTESGIKDYRSQNVGLFATTNHRPTNYSEFLASAEVRRRYWARNTTAWPIFKSFKPNISHKYLATLEHMGKLHWLVTQNVDNLHHKAGSRKLTELHGTVYSVICLQCNIMWPRDEIQKQIFRINPGWSASPEGSAPDADVFVSEDAVKTFKTPDCVNCGGNLKPDVIFFGDNIPKQRVEWISERITESDAMMIIGSSVETYSAFRHVKQAKDLGLPLLVLNIGHSRADPLADIIINARSGEAFALLFDRHRVS